MNYEKKYEEALERARDVYTYYCDDREQLRKIESIFPELKESEDERIRKRIYNYINITLDDNESTEKEKWLAWLEKQSEKQKSVNIDIDKMINEYANNNEPDNELFGKPINCMIRAYKQGLKDAIRKFALKP